MNMEIVDHVTDGKELNFEKEPREHVAMSIYENNNILRIGSKIMKEQLNKSMNRIPNSLFPNSVR